MRRVGWFTPATYVLGCAVLAACFPKHTESAAEMRSEVFVYVANDLLAPSRITVRLVPDSGAKQTLGFVPAAAHQMLNLRAAPGIGRARLEAQPRGAPEVVSPAFELANAAIISWDLRQNSVQLVPRTP